MPVAEILFQSTSLFTTRINIRIKLSLLFMVILAFPVHATNLSSHPANNRFLQLAASRFEEPLVATAATTPAEDATLMTALSQPDNDVEQQVSAFLTAYPQSGWSMALQTNLGLRYYHQGRFSKAIEAWESAWKLGKPVVELKAKALADRALGELMRMHARLGHVDRLTALFAEIGKRPVTGAATEAVAGAREGLWLMKNKPGIAFLCGPKALKNLLLTQGVKAKDIPFIDAYPSSSTGTALSEVAQLATQAKFAHKLIYRSPGQAIPVPAIIHWKVNHYAALIGEKDGYYHVQDPTFGQDLWVKRDVIDSEASGYFLIPETQQHKDWRPVQLTEAQGIRGMGTTTENDKSATKPDDGKARGGCPNSGNNPPNKGMCGYNVHEMLVSLNLTDTPVGYTPPKGPAVYTTLTYNQREASQLANFNYFNVSPKWTLNWLSFIKDDPAVAGGSVTRIVAGGGYVDYTGYNASTGAFASDRTDGSVLVRTSASPITYERRLSSGGVELYGQSDAATAAPRRIFLTKIIDPAGNALTLNYELTPAAKLLRLKSITDATGRNTTFSYANTESLLITTITDPFGRSATLSYDANGHLSSIKDVINLTSSFNYNTASLIDSMTTPYGITTFTFDDSSGNQRWLEATDSVGTERVEYVQEISDILGAYPYPAAANIPQGIINPYNAYINSRNTFYWDKYAYQKAPPVRSGTARDYTQARIKHWTHLASNWYVTANTVESLKYPLENRIWYNYPDQNSSIGAATTGSLDKPTRTGRVLDDGTTQLTQTGYNVLGNIICEVDALGRKVVYEYDTNQIDIKRIKRKTLNWTPTLETCDSTYNAADYSTIAQYTYNSQHLPLTYTDAAGQTTSYTYNAAGQLTKETNPLNQSTSYVYNALGQLTSVVNANNATILTLTYTPEGNIASQTDSFSQVRQYSYDAFDRLLTTTYPNQGATVTTKNTWNKLDLVAVKDRMNRVTSYQYDANRKLIRVTDPMNQIVDYSYYPNGTLKSITDENGHKTTWNRDIQSRVTSKVLADNKHTDYVYEATTSRLKDTVDAKGQTKRLVYDKNNQITSISYLNPAVATPNVSFSYDTYFPRVTSMTDGTGTTQYQYKAPGSLGALSLAQEDGAYQNDTIAYQYDALGRVTTRTVDSTPETFAYDTLGRVTNHNSALGNFNRSYWGQTSNMTGQHSVLVGGVSVGSDFDWCAACDYHIRGITHSSSVARSYFMFFSDEPRIDLIKETAPVGVTWYYHDYDATDRLLSVQPDIGGYAQPPGSQFALNYDPASNITKIQYAPPTQTSIGADVVNQITTINNTVQTSYDNNGNLTKTPTFSNLQWDAESRLVKAEVVPNSVYYSFTYDGLNRRIGAKYTNQAAISESRYLWCGEQICQKRSNTDTVTGRYFDEGEVVVSSGLKAYYAKDHLGSVRDVLNVSTGNVIKSIDYYPNGQIKSSSGTFEPEFEFAGMQSFPFMTGGPLLTYYRVYDPALGRWLSRDPIEEAGGINLYGYVGGNPVNFRDPLGLSPAEFYEKCKRSCESIGQAVKSFVTYPMLVTNIYKCTCTNIPKFNFNEPEQCPIDEDGNEWKWKGKPPQGGDQGGYKNPNGPESLHPDLDHGGDVKPHWDYNNRDGSDGYRIFEDGTIKQK